VALFVLLLIVLIVSLISNGRLALRSDASTLHSFGSLRVPILLYHYVDKAPPEKGWRANGLTVRTRDFEWEMEWLQSHGYHTVTLQRVYAAANGGPALPSRPVVLTFDDGTLDNYTVAYPILRRHGFVATFFVITNYVGRTGCMTWDQLREMQSAGMVIGSHTVRHVDLTKLTPAALQVELAVSRSIIGRELGHDPLIISYPMGFQNRSVVEAARAAGYQIGVTATRAVWVSSASFMTLPRISMGRSQDLKQFEKALGMPVTI
jgi:peptidoglycan/xylan/chitin deacetylase (PgdA/CDA1 family)